MTKKLYTVIQQDEDGDTTPFSYVYVTLEAAKADIRAAVVEMFDSIDLPASDRGEPVWDAETKTYTSEELETTFTVTECTKKSIRS